MEIRKINGRFTKSVIGIKKTTEFLNIKKGIFKHKIGKVYKDKEDLLKQF